MSTNFVYIPERLPEWGEFSSQIVTLIGLTFTCTLFGIKTYRINYKTLTYARILVVSLYICTWAFTASSAVLAYTNNGNPTSCFFSIMVCDLFYAGTKLIIYLWLIERAFIVSGCRTRRVDNWMYRFHIFLMTPYVGIFALMINYHNAISVPTGECYIGLKPIANIPLLVYDTVFNLYMTILFVIPLIRVGRGANANWKNSRLYSLTKRTLIASTVCLVASFANAFSATILHGEQRGYLCMMCCTIDVTINICTIHWVTNPSKVPRHIVTTMGDPQQQHNNNFNNDTTTSQSDHSHSFNFQKHSQGTDHSTLGPLPSATYAEDLQHNDSILSNSPYYLQNRSSLSIQDSQCSTKSLTKAAQIIST
ncbi:hypothetical protein BJ944DRAFT_271871 [Cunninghamella echinulata]|nr:hypothetical protein BJ944DRAFT_271871 [Cunninghamella echinulata]